MNEEWKGLSLAELVDLMEPMPDPAPISMLPQTAGWIWLAIAVLLVFCFSVWKFIQARRKSAYRREALRELATSSDDPRDLAELLRRTALTAYSRNNVASLHGVKWLAFLDQAYGGTAFTDGIGQAVATAPYNETTKVSGLKPLIETWIKTHEGDAA